MRPRRIVFDLVAIFALPVAYEIFRMGFYAVRGPEHRAGEGRGRAAPGPGWAYAQDFIGPYRLWLTALLIVAVLVIGYLRPS